MVFTRPHFYIPFIVAGFSIVMGLVLASTFWREIRPGFRSIAILVTFVCCVLSVEYYYEERRRILEREILREMRRGWRKGLSARMQTLIMPALGAAFILFIWYATMNSANLWGLVRWFAYDSPPEIGESLPQKVLAVLPFISLVGYCVLTISFSTSSALMLARHYTKDLRNIVPQPIFLDNEALASVVRREAETELGRGNPETVLPIANLSGMFYARLPANQLTAGNPRTPQREFWVYAATWTWDELERTDDGGIMMKVARDEVYKFPKRTGGPNHIPHGRVSYIVRADPWGRITSIKREEKKAGK
jgi:hypothetical protein